MPGLCGLPLFLPVPGVHRGLPGQLRELSSSGLAVGSFQHVHSSVLRRNAYRSPGKGAQAPPGFPFMVCLPLPLSRACSGLL